MDRLPILPLGQVVVYPPVVLPMALSDPHAVQLIDEVVQGNKRLLLGIVKPLAGAERTEGGVMQARPDELYEVGTLGSVVRMLKLGDGSVRVMVQGLERARFVEIGPAEHWLVAGFETLASTGPEDARTEALKRTVQAQFSRVIDIAPYLGEELHEVLSGITDGSKLADFAAANLDLALPAKAELLSIEAVNRRLSRLAALLRQAMPVRAVGPHVPGPPRPEGRARDPRPRPLRPEDGEGAHPRVPRRPHAQPAGAWQHPVLCGAARGRQDVARPEHRGGAGAALHPRVAGWS